MNQIATRQVTDKFAPPPLCSLEAPTHIIVLDYPPLHSPIAWSDPTTQNQAKKKGGGGRGGGAKASDSAGRGKPEGSATGGGGGRGGGRPTDATVIQKLAARVSSGATSGVGAGRGGSGGGGGVGGDGRDPLKGVDVAGLEEISIAEGDWQSVFRYGARMEGGGVESGGRVPSVYFAS